MSAYSSRSRTPSPRRTRSPRNDKTRSARTHDSRSYYSDDYSDYSDSFVSDDEKTTTKKGTKTTYKGKPTGTFGGKKAAAKNTNKGGKNKKTGAQTPRKDYVTQRVLSARRLKINELKNENDNFVQQIQELKLESKLLKRTQFRTEKALERFEDQDSELPQMLQRHSEEVRTLRQQIRKYKEKYSRSEKRKRDIEDEHEKTKRQLKKLQQIAEDKKLGERDELNRKLAVVEQELDEKERKYKELDRHIENLNKNHRRELAAEMMKQKETHKHVEDLEAELEKIQTLLKEKEKELDIKNIYSNRVIKPPHKLTSRQSSPTPPPQYGFKKQKKSSPDLSPREKAKIFEERRREDERRQREERERLEKEKHEKEERNLREQQPPKMDWDSLGQSDKKEQEERERREHEERDRREREEQKRRKQEEENKRRQWEKDENNMKSERERMKQESEDRRRREKEREERERRVREEKAKRQREEELMREKLEREERELHEERERREQEERERKERERRTREEANRLANDTKAQEEKRKKEMLLAKLKQMDDSKAKGDPIDINPVTRRPLKEDSDVSPSENRKSYAFSKPVENLHNGLPSHDDVTVPVLSKNKKKGLFDDDSDSSGGGYNPSFARRQEPRVKGNTVKAPDTPNFGSPKGGRADKKTNLMENLFGGNAAKPKSSFGEDDIFSSSTKAKPVSDKKSMPWDSKANNNDSMVGSPVFGQSSNNNNKLLPRRHRQEVSAFHARPAVKAIDDFDDDIEEVIL